MSNFHIPSDPQPLPPSDNAEVHIGGGNTRVSAHGGIEVHSAGLGNGASGILATARSVSGRAVAPSELKPNDRITVDGVEMLVKTAESMGRLGRNPNTGLYVETGSDLRNETPMQSDDNGQEQHDDGSDPKPELFFKEAEDFVSNIPQAAQAGVLNDIIATGEVSENTVKQAAQQLGMEPAEAVKYLDVATEQFSHQANAVLREYGISDGNDFAQWAMRERASGWKEAVSRHQTGRTTAGYRPLALDYLAHVHDTDPRSIVGGVVGRGVSARLVGKTVYVTLPGVPGEMPFKAALKAGFVGRGR